jgi:hypothetical protein
LSRIAFDLDGVLADMEAELVHQTEILFGSAMTKVLEALARSGQTPPTRAADRLLLLPTRPRPPLAEPASTSATDGAGPSVCG